MASARIRITRPSSPISVDHTPKGASCAMQNVNRRHMFKLFGIGTVLGAGAAIPTFAWVLKQRQDQLHFRAMLGLPQPPLPSYATYVIEGTVDLVAGTGMLASRVLAGHP